MKNVLYSCLVVLGFVTSGQVQALHMRCEGCSDAQMYQMAKSAGPGLHAVVSFSTAKITGWSVEVDPGYWMGPDGQPYIPSESPSIDQMIVTAYPIEPDLLRAFEEMTRAYDQTGGTFKIERTAVAGPDNPHFAHLHPDDYASGYTYVQDYGMRGRLNQAIYSQAREILNFTNPTEGLNVTKVEVLLTIRFTDGTYLIVTVTRDHHPSDGDYKVYDKDGNLIITANAPQNAGTYRFRDSSGDARFRDHGQSMGIQFIGGWSSGGGSRSYTCSWDGRTLKCVYPP